MFKNLVVATGMVLAPTKYATKRKGLQIVFIDSGSLHIWSRHIGIIQPGTFSSLYSSFNNRSVVFNEF